MSATYLCDGCGQPIAQPIVIGHALKREYCDGCAILAERFLELEEKLRRKLVADFDVERILLAAKVYEVKGVSPNFKLPDFVNAR